MVNAHDLPPAGRLEGSEHRLPVRVYFEDTDAGGMVYHATYLRFMERARTEMLRAAGIGHAEAFAAGEGAYVISALSIRYRAPARLDDALVVASRVRRQRGATVDIQQRVMRDVDIVAEAEVTAVYVAPSGRPRRPPAAWTASFKRLQGVEAAS